MLKFAVLGAGNIAKQFVHAISLVEGAEIIAVASKTYERTTAFQKEHSIPLSYSSYEEMLKNPDIDAVYIATTNNYHYDNIIDCLNAGKHILCEKPMVLTEADARKCFELAREKNLFLMEAMWSRCLPALSKAKEWIDSGRLGTICSANSVIGFCADVDTNHRLLNPSLGGGAIYDIGVYAIEIVSYLIGEPVKDIVFTRRNHDITGVDIAVSMILSYSIADACIQCMFTATPKEYTIICGTKGFIEIPASHSIREIYLYDENRTLVERFYAPFENGFTFEIGEMIRCISEGQITSEINPPEMTIECAKIFDTINSQKNKLL